MFDWIRRKVANAVYAGINDAFARLEQQGASIPDDVELLTDRTVEPVMIEEPVKIGKKAKSA